MQQFLDTLKEKNAECVLKSTEIVRNVHKELRQDIENRKNIWFHINMIHISMWIIAITLIIMNILMFKK
jgi:hypothetical protein